MSVGSLEGFMLDRGLLTSAELSKAQQVCAETGERLVTAVRRLGIVAGNDLARAVAAYYALPTVGEQDWPKTTLLSDVLSPRYLREHKVLPLAVDGQRLVLAAADPGHTAAINAIQLAAGRTIELRVAPAEDIDAAIDRFRPAEEAPAAAELPTASGGESDDDIEHLKDLALGAPVVRFVNQLLLDGLNSRATDIHIEPFRGKLNIRLRIDGMLTEARTAPAHMARAIVSRVKILSGLDIAERRLPQDGRARIKIEARTLDLRIATMPTIHGEAVAVRLLENVQRVLELGKLGFTESDERAAAQASCRAARADAGDRPDRQRQDHDAGRRAHHPQRAASQDPDHRGPDRVPARRHQPDPGQARDRHRLCQCAEALPAP